MDTSDPVLSTMYVSSRNRHALPPEAIRLLAQLEPPQDNKNSHQALLSMKMPSQYIMEIIQASLALPASVKGIIVFSCLSCVYQCLSSLKQFSSHAMMPPFPKSLKV